VDSDQQVDALSAEAMRVSLCLRDEEAAASGESVLKGVRPSRPDTRSVQLDVQQQGARPADMLNRRRC